MKEEIFWELQKKYNLLLDNENYDDLEKFAVECVKMGREEMRQECLAAVPEEMEAISIERYGEPSESTKEYMRSWSECREKTINNINAINTSIKEIEEKV